MKLSLDYDFLKSPPGILKILEFVFQIIAVILMIVLNDADNWKVAFFIASYVISPLVILVLTIVHMLKWTVFSVVFLIEKKLSKHTWNAILFISHILLAILCVVPAGFMAAQAIDWDKAGLNKIYPTRWNYLISALVFGFPSIAMLLVDAVTFIRNVIFD